MVLESFNRNTITIAKIFVYWFFLYSQVLRDLDIDFLTFNNFQENYYISNVIFSTDIFTASNF